MSDAPLTVVDSLEAQKVGPNASDAIAFSPWVNAVLVAKEYAGAVFGPLSVDPLADSLVASIKTVQAGSMKEPEAMLIAQAVTLQSMFTYLAAHAAKAPRPEAMDRYMRLAFKAQNQCRMTLETLATIKNPPTVFARQANIANGPQQINNGPVPPAGDSGTAPNELLETTHGKRLDTAASGAAGRVDAQPAPVGAVKRAALRRG